jgi:Fe-Mn family superoxide dismutase
VASDVEDVVELKHELPPLPYAYSALEPHIDARTMTLHHDKHHATYVEKLNAELEKHPSLRERSAVWLLLHLEKVPEKSRIAIRNNAGGHVNHSMFWRAMSPGGGGKPSGALADAIKRDFDGFEQFKTLFAEAGAKVFGSGWVWLVRSSNGAGRLQIVTTPGHDNPMMQGLFPLMVNDVWEHAYYLKHENRRPDYLKGWWSVADWTEAARRFDLSGTSAQKRWESDGGLTLKQA